MMALFNSALGFDLAELPFKWGTQNTLNSEQILWQARFHYWQSGLIIEIKDGEKNI